MSEMPGRPLGSGYLLDGLIGSGGMGKVWRAHSREGAPYAIKVLRSDLTSDPTFVARFLQEAQILKRISGPNLVSVRDLVAEGTTLGIVMDLVDGADLRKELNRRGTVPAKEAVWLVDQLLAGLSIVHAAGIVHRDLKPENVLMDRMRAGLLPRITDFGIARIVETGPAARTTAIVGTPDYMAPELADGESPTPQSDLYSVGIMLYELLVGVTPFAGGSPLAVMRRHVSQEPGRPEGIPDPLWAQIAALLAKEPGNRPRSADELRQRLASVTPALGAVAALPRLSAPPESRPVAQQTVVATTLVNEAPKAPAEVRGKGRAKVLIAGVAVLLVFVIAAAAFFLTRQGATQATAAGSQPTATAPKPTATPTPTVEPSLVVPGATPGANQVTVAPRVPTVKGMQFGPATTILQRAGYSVTLNEVMDETKADGTVLDQNPAGDSIPTNNSVILTIARHAVTEYLADWKPVQGDDPGTGTVTINGKTYTHGMWMNLPYYSSGTEGWQYALGRGYRQVKGVVGLSDTSNSAAVVRYEFLVDGRQVKVFDTNLGKTNPVDIDVSGGLRLEIKVTRISGGNVDAYASFGDLQIIGIPGEVPTSSPTPIR